MPRPSGMKGHSFLGKEPRPAKVLEEDKRNAEWVEEDGYIYQLHPCAQFKNKKCNSYEYFYLFCEKIKYINFNINK